jgi:hypothetical protein
MKRGLYTKPKQDRKTVAKVHAETHLTKPLSSFANLATTSNLITTSTTQKPMKRSASPSKQELLP